MQRIAILDLGEATNHEQPGILPAQKFDLSDSVQKCLPLRIGWLLFGIGRRHVVGLHVGRRLLPPLSDRRIARIAERRLKINPPLLPILAVAADTVGLNEGSDAVLKRLLGVGLQRGEIPINPRLRQTSPSEDQHEPAEGLGPLKTAR